MPTFDTVNRWALPQPRSGYDSLGESTSSLFQALGDYARQKQAYQQQLQLFRAQKQIENDLSFESELRRRSAQLQLIKEQPELFGTMQQQGQQDAAMPIRSGGMNDVNGKVLPPMFGQQDIQREGMMAQGQGTGVSPFMYIPDLSGKSVGIERIENPLFKKSQEAEKTSFDKAFKLRSSFDELAKPFRTIRDSYSRVEAAQQDPSAAGDLALIFNYMKILDPGSVVRESEFATAQNSAGVPERIRAMYNRVLNGERLSDETRKDFTTKAKQLYESQEEIQKKHIEKYSELSKRYGLNPQDIVTDLYDVTSNNKVSEDIVSQYMQKYPNRSREEIIKAMQKQGIK